MNALACTLFLLLPPEEPAAAQVTIHVERSSTDELWTVLYRFHPPRGEAVFSRNTNLFREERWTVRTPDVSIVRSGDAEVLRSTNGQPFEEVRLSFAPHSDVLPKDYEFHVPFTDGGVLFYTGHLEVRSEQGPLTTELRFRARPGEEVAHAGQAASELVVRASEPGFGTYVYFGNAEPLETPDVLAVLDPGLPGWIRSETLVYLPLLFGLYRERLGVSLETKPMVFFSYESGEPGSTSYSGGTLPGTVQLSVRGQGWDPDDRGPDSAFASLIQFLAHESAHLWNSQLARSRGGAWMHEGSADALAFRTLRELDVIDDARLYALFTQAINACAQGLDGCALSSSAEARRFRNHYTCGSSLAFATELALAEADSALDLFAFWAELIATARRAEPPEYDEESYLSLLERLAPESDLGERIQTFLDAVHPDPAASLFDLLHPHENVEIRLDVESGQLQLVPSADSR